MDDFEVYVVRVYRKDNTGFAGVVERVSGGQERSFRSATELWRTLADFLSIDASLECSRPDQENER